jgi:predicted DNA-binding helix-hairpin-helix protein
MSDIERLALLTSQMHLEPAEDRFQEPLPPSYRQAVSVKKALLPNGKSIRLLKTLLSSYCERDCAYCPFRAGRDLPRASFSPSEFARLFDGLHHAGFVEGIFLSSSIFHGSRKTQDQLLDTANLLRTKYAYRGYLHLKIMPGAEYGQVAEAMRLADRVSLNIEAPNPKALSVLAPQKDFLSELLQPLLWIEQIRSQQEPQAVRQGRWPSSTTQFVVGAAGETDLEILSAVSFLQQESRVSRVYFSSFNPYRDTPLESHLPPPAVRELRLYQADYLLRDYGFQFEDFIFNEDGSLPQNIDPKLAWAEEHLLYSPLEINLAPLHLLMRVPGIGPRRAKRILNLRHTNKIRSFDQLRKGSLISAASAPFILVDGKPPARQLQLL